jgi:hypothetical protein
MAWHGMQFLDATKTVYQLIPVLFSGILLFTIDM